MTTNYSNNNIKYGIYNNNIACRVKKNSRLLLKAFAEKLSQFVYLYIIIHTYIYTYCNIHNNVKNNIYKYVLYLYRFIYHRLELN